MEESSPKDIYYKVAEQISKENYYFVTNSAYKVNLDVLSLGKFQQGNTRYKVLTKIVAGRVRYLSLLIIFVDIYRLS